MFSTVVLVFACMNAVQMETKDAQKRLALMERKLDEGKPKQAYLLIDEMVEVSDRALGERIGLVRSVARLRMGQKNALSSITWYYEHKKDDPYRIARYSEALLANGKELPEAQQLLDDLEKRDLMPDAEGWATLAQLRDKAGDAAGRDRATDRCKKIAKRPEVCAPGGKVAMR